MDWNIGIGLEAKFHVPALNIEHRHFQQAVKAIGPSDDNRFPAFP
jgi:hypothetical protein